MSDTPYTRIESLGTIHDRRIIVGSLVVHFCIFEEASVGFFWAMPEDINAFIQSRASTLAANGPFTSQDEAEKSCAAYFDDLRTKALKCIEENQAVLSRKGRFKL